MWCPPPSTARFPCWERVTDTVSISHPAASWTQLPPDLLLWWPTALAPWWVIELHFPESSDNYKCFTEQRNMTHWIQSKNNFFLWKRKSNYLVLLYKKKKKNWLHLGREMWRFLWSRPGIPEYHWQFGACFWLHNWRSSPSNKHWTLQKQRSAGIKMHLCFKEKVFWKAPLSEISPLLPWPASFETYNVESVSAGTLVGTSD